MAQLNFSCPDEIVFELDKLVDGIRYRSRANLIGVILSNFLDDQMGKQVMQTKKQQRKFVLRIPQGLLEPLDEIRTKETTLSRNQFILGIIRDYIHTKEMESQNDEG